MTDEERIARLEGHSFALEALLARLVWVWTLDQPHPPTALARYLRPVEEQMAVMLASQSPPTAAMQAAHQQVREFAQELERTLQREALNRASGEGSVQ
jgi:hypothetical protein